MIHKVNITAEAMNYIRAKSESGLTSYEPQPDGSYDVELSDDILERLQSHQLTEESLSDTIIRLIAARSLQ